MSKLQQKKTKQTKKQNKTKNKTKTKQTGGRSDNVIIQ